MAVIYKGNPIHVDNLQIWSVSFDFTNIDHLIDILFSFTGQLESSWKSHKRFINKIFDSIVVCQIS